MHLLFIYCFLFVIPLTAQDESVISFDPSSLTVELNENRSVNIRLVKTDITYPISISFRYDDHVNNSARYIETIPDIVFTNETKGDHPSQSIYIIGRRRGHLVVTAQSEQVKISSTVDYLLIDVERSKVLDIIISIVGWIYFAAWSISFYPQIILNFRRRSVTGLNFDFLALNIIGHSCYSVFNGSMYFSKDIQKQYSADHPHGVLPVLLNDVIFSFHAVVACLVTIIQCMVFQRDNQRVSYVARVLAAIMIVFLFISSIVSFSKHLSTLDLIYFFSYVKLAITIIKYCPQAYMNHKNKSTEGWSIGNILLDFTGGVLSLIQMFLLADNYDDWTSIFGSPTKLGLGLFSIFFDVIFILQHYVCFRHRTREQIIITNEVINEKSPLLDSKS